jgi:hypothetical protein
MSYESLTTNNGIVRKQKDQKPTGCGFNKGTFAQYLLQYLDGPFLENALTAGIALPDEELLQPRPWGEHRDMRGMYRVRR